MPAFARSATASGSGYACASAMSSASSARSAARSRSPLNQYPSARLAASSARSSSGSSAEMTANALLHPCHRLVATPREGVDPPEPPEDTGGGMRVALLPRGARSTPRRAGAPSRDRRHARPSRPRGRAAPPSPTDPRSAPPPARSSASPLRPRRATRRALRPAPAWPAPSSDLGCVVRVRGGLVGGEVVRGDHLDHLVLVRANAALRWSAAARCLARRSRFESVS